MRRVVAILVLALLLAGMVMAETVTSEDGTKIQVVEMNWGGVITDDGSTQFIVGQGAVGLVTSSDGTLFYSLPPFFPIGNATTPVPDSGSGSSGGQDDSVGKDQVQIDAQLGVFIATAPGFPDTTCTFHLESYPNQQRIYDYEWWLTDNLLSAPSHRLDGGDGRIALTPTSTFTESKTLVAPRTGQFWCKLRVRDEKGKVVVEAAKQVEAGRTMDLGKFFANLDWSKVIFWIVVGVVLVCLVIWGIWYSRRRDKK